MKIWDFIVLILGYALVTRNPKFTQEWGLGLDLLVLVFFPVLGLAISVSDRGGPSSGVYHLRFGSLKNRYLLSLSSSQWTIRLCLRAWFSSAAYVARVVRAF